MAATKTTRPSGSRVTTRTKPQDHKPTRADVMAAAEEVPAGHDLLLPVEQLRSGEQIAIQADLMGLFDDLGIDFDAASKAASDGKEVNAEIETSADSLRAIGRMGVILESYVVEGREEDYRAFDTGRGAPSRVMELGMWYLARLGESDGSAS